MEALFEAQMRLKEYNVDLSGYSYKMTTETFKKLIEECKEMTGITLIDVQKFVEKNETKIYGIPVEIVDDPIELSAIELSGGREP